MIRREWYQFENICLQTPSNIFRNSKFPCFCNVYSALWFHQVMHMHANLTLIHFYFSVIPSSSQFIRSKTRLWSTFLYLAFYQEFHFGPVFVSNMVHIIIWSKVYFIPGLNKWIRRPKKWNWVKDFLTNLSCIFITLSANYECIFKIYYFVVPFYVLRFYDSRSDRFITSRDPFLIIRTESV